MTHHPAYSLSGSRRWNSLDRARHEFTELMTGPTPLSVDGAAFPGLPERPVPLDEVRDRLEMPGPQRTRDAVWAHLVHRAYTGPHVWLVGCVGVALPHLTRLAARLTTWFPGDPTDIHDAVLSGFLTGMATVRPGQSKIPTRLWWAAKRAGDKALREARRQPIPTDREFDSRPPARPSGHEDLVLARAVAEGVLTRTEADVIGTTRLEPVSLAAWAHRCGVARSAAYKIRKRAETRLKPYLLGCTVSIDSRDPVGAAVITAQAPRSVRATRPARTNAVEAAPDQPLCVIERLAHGADRSNKKSWAPVSKIGPKPGEQECGTTVPAARSTAVRSAPALRSSGVRSCA